MTLLRLHIIVVRITRLFIHYYMSKGGEFFTDTLCLSMEPLATIELISFMRFYKFNRVIVQIYILNPLKKWK